LGPERLLQPLVAISREEEVVRYDRRLVVSNGRRMQLGEEKGRGPTWG